MTQNAAAIPARILEYPAKLATDENPERLSWFQRVGYELGILTMPNIQKPPGFYFNYSTALFYITMLAAIAGISWWTWQRAEQSGDARGYERAQREQVQKEVDNQANAQKAQQAEIERLQKLILANKQ